MKIPQKRSLVTETRLVIQEAIQSGLWKEHLPGERLLCERFQVSRPTLRQALKQLEKDGFLSNKQGQHRKIMVTVTKTPVDREKTTIGYLCPFSTKEMFGYTSRKIAAIEHHIHQNELNFELFIRPGCYNKSPAKALQTLMDETKIHIWILQQTNLEMQLWFQENHIPTIITGTRFDGIDLPYVDVDNSAACRHAVGLLLAKKRKSICFLKSMEMLPGDIQSERGFTQGINKNKSAKGRIARCKDTPEGIANKLDAIMESRNKPDAFIMDEPSQAYCTASYLLQKGFRLPEDFSLICRTESHDFQFMQPSIAHYSRNTPELASRTAELGIKLSKGKAVEAKGILIIPNFVPGRSI